MRVELLSDIKKRNNRETVRAEMEKTFTLRRQEVILDAPMVSDVQERWPSLFDVIEKKKGGMETDDFRACLISMGYDLVKKS
ncbi:hypothetical protein SRHO_G00154800 [Serrasalmus rhombeus]